MINTGKILLEFNNKTSITEKLDTWYHYVYMPLNKKVGFYAISKEVFKLFNCSNVVTGLSIPKELYSSNFDFEVIYKAEYTNWFLKFNARLYFELHLTTNFRNKLNSPIKNEFIEAELKRIKLLEQSASDALINGKFDIFKTQIDQLYKKEIILKRIQSNYYEQSSFNSELVHSISSLEVRLYADHIYFKNWLIDHFPSNSTYRVERDSFNDYIVRIIEGFSRKPDNIRNENDFRTVFFRAFSVLDVYISSEAESNLGRTDLLVKGSFGTKIFEFKIWGRNDYKKVVSQLLKYLTDFEDSGYIIIMNPNKSQIHNSYRAIVCKEETYIKDSYQIISNNLNNFKYYISKHSRNGRMINVYHFLVNF